VSSFSQEPWREFLTTERLQRIDTLTYLLGRYPPSQQTIIAMSDVGGGTAAIPLTAATTPTPSRTKTAPHPSQRNDHSVVHPSSGRAALSAKAKKVAALNAVAFPSFGRKTIPAEKAPRSASPSVSTPATPASRLWAHRTVEASRALPMEKGPLTPLPAVERLAQQWLHKERRLQAKQASVDAAQEATWQSLLQHPPHLFADEAAVYARFGMGAFVSPNAPGFTGLFRQRWQDFHVTEVAIASSTSDPSTGVSPPPRVIKDDGPLCDVAPVSRNFDFSIPALPSELLCRADGAATTGLANGAAEAGLSFFAVDVKQRLRELQTEDVRERDLLAVAEVLAKEPGECNSHVRASPHKLNMPQRRAGDSSVADSTEPPVRSRSNASEAPLSLEASEERSNMVSSSSSRGNDADGETLDGRRHYYLQCTLHKQHIAHGNALAAIAQTLRIHPHSISVAGIKDYVGDTVQRVRLENVSPASALAANRRFRQKRLWMTLSNFSYETGPLSPGDLFGNHFRVVLRDVDVAKRDLADAITSFVENGFPNYYGCQRFSWFAGRQDAAFALLRHNWLAFAFLFLNFTGKDRSLRELLQRPKKYPHPAQDEYRRGVVRRLRQLAIEPADLDVAPFLSCPALTAPLTHVDGRPFSEVEELICAQLREAYFDLNVQSRRLTAQRLSSFLWNQVLTLRLHHIGGAAVLDGDLVAPASIRQLSLDVGDRKEWYQAFGNQVSGENRHRYTIEDVVHPGFSFDAITLPDNIVGAYYKQICDKYALDWMAQHSRTGLRDFREPPRPIIRKPLNLSYEYNAEARVLTLQFALERGCYANVALSELMKSVRCLGSEEVTLLPLSDALWDVLGKEDPGHVTTLQDIYEGYEDGVGFMNDEAPVERAVGSETKPWDHVGPLFLPASEDPFRKAHRWGSRHLLRNSERHEQEAEDMKRMLFDRPLAKQLKEGEVDTYAGHIVPLPPNASAKEVYAKVMQRKRRYAGSPKMAVRMSRSTLPSSRRGSSTRKLPSFQSLNKNSWNFTW
jgi:tRNA(Glu) U13 pseudouridine synthase TruD